MYTRKNDCAQLRLAASLALICFCTADITKAASDLTPSVTELTGATVQGDGGYQLTATLSSATAGVAWTASSPNSWVTFAASSGTTPATLRVKLDATQLTAGLNQGTVTVTSAAGSVTLPVKLTVDALTVTVMRSDPASTKVYAISEATVTSGTSRAYLLEIDSLLKKITRVLPVGTSATDLAIHHGDNRIYVPNWRPGGLLGVSLTSFQVEKTISTPAFAGVGHSMDDAYRVAAGAAGRLVTEGEDQWIDVNLYNTATGSAITTAPGFHAAGGGAFEPAGRYYYRYPGFNTIDKFDTAGDTFTSVKSIERPIGSVAGPRGLIVSDDGKRVICDSVVFDSDLNVAWVIGDPIYCVSGDGRFAFSETKIYDVQKQQQIAAMPLSAKVSAFNSVTGRLVVQNGTAFGFFSPVEHGPLGAALSPMGGAIVNSPSKLQWTAMPGVDSYRVYLGTSLVSVTNATASSPEYQGVVTPPSFALTTTLQPGTYYWRVDLLIGSQVVASQVQSFTVNTVAPAVTELTGTTVQGYGSYQLSTMLSSVTSGVAWTASSPNSWITFATSSGTTPATLQVKLDATKLPTGLNQGTVTVTGGGGSFTLPVKLQVDDLALTVLRSDPDSTKIYAISEAAVTSGPPRAFLLEIDSALENITRAVWVGTSATDLAIHHGDNCIYVPNWKTGGLLVVNLTPFQVVKTLSTPAYGGSSNDAYSVAAGAVGRVVTEAENQLVNVSLYNTATGALLATTNQREGGGQFEPTGRYYYHGDDRDSGAALHKLDTDGDAFTSVKTTSITGVSYFGSRTIVVSGNGNRIFWNGGIFDTDLNVLWSTDEEIHCASSDGKYAFGKTKIYDTIRKTQVLGMPATTAVSAFNTATAKLVVQSGTKIAFYPVGDTITFSAPTLSLGSATATSLVLNWTDNNLETGFTLQMRQSGSSTWIDVSPAITANTVAQTISNLTPTTTYEFRIKADGPLLSSGWSNTLSAKTLVQTETRNVYDVFALADALTEAAARPSVAFTINLGSGTYNLSYKALPSLSGHGTTIQGSTGDIPSIIDGTGFNNDAMLVVTGQDVYIGNVVFENAINHAIAIQPGSNGGSIVSCGFYSYTTASAIEGRACTGWTVIGNALSGIVGTTVTAEPAIHFYSGASNLEISYNLILNCDRGIGLGNGALVTDAISDAWIYNNMIADTRTTGYPGPGIGVVFASNAFVDNNTVYQVGHYANSIEYTYCSGISVRNNLVGQAITGLTNSSVTLATNNTSAVASWFLNPANCDLRLEAYVSGVVDAGTTIDGLIYDIGGDSRPYGKAYDIGADEYTGYAPPSSSGGSSSSSSSSSSGGTSSSGSSGGGGGGGGAPSVWFFAAIFLLGLARRLTAKVGH